MCFWHPNPFHTAQNHQQCLPNKFHVTESLNPVCFPCFDHFQWKRDGFQPFYPSYSMVPWSSSSAISPQRLTSLKPKRISCRATELPLPILLLHVLSLEYSSCTVHHCYLFSLTFSFCYGSCTSNGRIAAPFCHPFISTGSLGVIDIHLSVTCCVCLVISLRVLHHSYAQRRGSGLPTHAGALSYWLGFPLMSEDICSSAAAF